MKVTEKLSSIENEHSIIVIRLIINKRVWKLIMKEWSTFTINISKTKLKAQRTIYFFWHTK